MKAPTLLVLALMGCGVHQDDWAREFGIAFCKHEQACRAVSTAVDCTRPGYWPDEGFELEALREGLVGYSPAGARRCIDLLAKVGCIGNLKSRLFASVECRAAFPGLVAEGEPCTQSYPVEVCGPDSKCGLSDLFDPCGTCVPTAKAGEEVMSGRSSKVCGNGLKVVTDGGRMGPYLLGVCAPRPSLGESCDHTNPCIEWLDCSPSRLEPGEKGTCVALVAPDAGTGELEEDCRPPQLGYRYTQWCAWPWTCSEGGCVDRSARLGDACSATTECELLGSCVEGVCVARARAAEPCAPAGCEGQLFCNDDGICQSIVSLCR